LTATGPQGSSAPRPSPSWADLGPRLLSAAVIIAVIAVGLYFGGYVWAGLAAVVFGVTYREWEQMITLRPLAPLGMVLIALLAIGTIAYPAFGPLATIGSAIAAIVVALFGGKALIPWRIGGLIYFALTIIAALGMRGTGPAGLVAGWYLGVVIASNDTGAYFVGRVLGGPKLAPMISPAKTISGAVGGWVIGTLAGTAFWMIFTPSPWWIGLLLTGVLGLAGQSGDLAESAIKRTFRIKDSGDIIPGHGGFMDRLDSVAAGLLLVFVVGALHGGLDRVAEGLLYW
jgi:phosphatidate cytidylyltransferase